MEPNLVKEKQSLELLFCACMENGTPENFLSLAKQAEKIATLIDPKQAQEIQEATHMKGFLEPHFIGTVRASGDLWISKTRAGTQCYVYFAGNQK